MVQAVAGPSANVSQDLLYVTIRGATVGGAPRIRIRRWAWVASPTALVGARLVALEDVDYLPLIQSSADPVTEAPYGDAHRYTVVLSVVQLRADNVAQIEVILVDGLKPGHPVLVAGPQARAIGYMPIGAGGVGTGGGPSCGPY